MNVSLQLTVSWSSEKQRYAFRELLLHLDFRGVQEAFQVDGSPPEKPVPTVNGGTLTFDYPGFFPDLELPMEISTVKGLSTFPILPEGGVPLFRFAYAAEGARFEGKLHV